MRAPVMTYGGRMIPASSHRDPDGPSAVGVGVHGLAEGDRWLGAPVDFPATSTRDVPRLIDAQLPTQE